MLYNFEIGDRISVYGQPGLNGEFVVKNIEFDALFCESDRGILIMPTDRVMPFAVFKKNTHKPSVEEVHIEEKETEVAKTTDELIEETADVKLEGKIIYFNPIASWGKVSYPKFRNGLFFHISQVTDPALKDVLSAYHKEDEITVKYELGKTFKGMCALNLDLVEVKLAEEEKAKPVEEEPAEEPTITAEDNDSEELEDDTE